MLAVADCVRFAVPEDEDDLLVMCRAKHAEEGLRSGTGRPFLFSEDKTRGTLQCALQARRNAPDAGNAWCGVLGERGNLHGSVYLTLQTPYDSEEMYLSQLWSWIYPSFRRSSNAMALLVFSQKLAISLGVKMVGGVVSYEEGDDTAKLRFFRRNGCQPIATLYSYDYDAAGAA